MYRKKIKIVHFVSGLISGGAEQMIYNYCKLFDPNKYEFVIAYQHEPVITCKEKFDSIGIKTIRITARSENFVKNIIDGFKVIRYEKPDIVHAHMNLVNFCALIPAFFCGVDVRICHSHIAENATNFMYNVFAFFCKKISTLFATDYFACGYEAGEFYYGKKYMKKGKVKLIKNAIDFADYIYDPILDKRFREKYKLSGELVIGHIGRFSYQKNHERLIEIFYQIYKKKKDTKLILIGSGSLENKIREQVQKCGLEERVLFLGNIRDTKSAYSAMDIFVLPSRFEGLPVVAIEAQVAGLPCVFSSTIDKSCDLTGLIQFCDLEMDDQYWANIILEWHKSYNKNYDRSHLEDEYDIKKKVYLLQQYYMDALNRCKS